MSDAKSIAGIHHVTAITADAQKNIDFYTGVLGLRMVKLTVNYDDPSSYHLYYGDELGRPGTALTFFAWPGAHRGRIGPPQVTVTAFAAPAASLPFWSARLRDNGVTVREAGTRFGEGVISFVDPDGMGLEIVGQPQPQGQPWRGGSIPIEHAIHGFHSVTLSEEGHEKTAKLLTDVMGFVKVGEEQNRFRYRSADRFANIVDLLCVPDARHGTLGAGIVHHVAFRTADDAQQKAWLAAIGGAGLNVSPVMDRVYFHSIYYREPGGVLFEIATDGPGFTRDETVEKLGTSVRLPPWLEPHRNEIMSVVTPVRFPTYGK